MTPADRTLTVAIALSPAQLHILQHSLGLDQYGRGTFYRNHFCAGGKDEATCRKLVAMGYMTQHATTEMLTYFNCSVTEAGREAVRRESPEPPKVPAAQRRYQEWLNAESGLKFGEWLKIVRNRDAR